MTTWARLDRGKEAQNVGEKMGKKIGKSRGTVKEKVDEQQDFYKGDRER